SVHGTRRPTRALCGSRGPTEGSARKIARTASPGGRTDGADPEAAGHYGRGQARSRRRGKASGGVHREPRRGSIPRRGPLNAFEKVDRPARYARNPQTGERVRVKKTSVPRFRAGQGFKDLVSGSKKLPRGGEVAVKKAPKGSLTGGAAATVKKAAAKKTTKAAAAAKKTTAKKTTAKKTTATA